MGQCGPVCGPTLGQLDHGEESLGLTSVERLRWMDYSRLGYLNAENFHYQYELGILESSLYETSVAEYIKQFGLAWKELGFFQMGRPSFHAEVERILSKEEQSR